jgi:hypothetical protein
MTVANDFIEQSDKDLASAAHMLAAELSKITVELGRRGVETSVRHYADESVELQIKRVTRQEL